MQHPQGLSKRGLEGLQDSQRSLSAVLIILEAPKDERDGRSESTYRGISNVLEIYSDVEKPTFGFGICTLSSELANLVVISTALKNNRLQRSIQISLVLITLNNPDGASINNVIQGKRGIVISRFYSRDSSAADVIGIEASLLSFQFLFLLSRLSFRNIILKLEMFEREFYHANGLVVCRIKEEVLLHPKSQHLSEPFRSNQALKEAGNILAVNSVPKLNPFLKEDSIILFLESTSALTFLDEQVAFLTAQSDGFYTYGGNTND